MSGNRSEGRGRRDGEGRERGRDGVSSSFAQISRRSSRRAEKQDGTVGRVEIKGNAPCRREFEVEM